MQLLTLACTVAHRVNWNVLLSSTLDWVMRAMSACTSHCYSSVLPINRLYHNSHISVLSNRLFPFPSPLSFHGCSPRPVLGNWDGRPCWLMCFDCHPHLINTRALSQTPDNYVKKITRLWCPRQLTSSYKGMFTPVTSFREVCLISDVFVFPKQEERTTDD